MWAETELGCQHIGVGQGRLVPWLGREGQGFSVAGVVACEEPQLNRSFCEKEEQTLAEALSSSQQILPPVLEPSWTNTLP